MKMKLDKKGRITLPHDIQKSLNWRENDNVSLEICGENLVVSRKSEGCLFCESMESLVTMGEHRICRSCIHRMENAKDGETLYPYHIP